MARTAPNPVVGTQACQIATIQAARQWGIALGSVPYHMPQNSMAWDQWLLSKIPSYYLFLIVNLPRLSCQVVFANPRRCRIMAGSSPIATAVGFLGWARRSSGGQSLLASVKGAGRSDSGQRGRCCRSRRRYGRNPAAMDPVLSGRSYPVPGARHVLEEAAASVTSISAAVMGLRSRSS